jgi:hypothetical protein
MPQEISISYQAVKSKVYKLVDAMVEGEKTAMEVQESMRRWWSLIHPADRPVAQKYMLMVLERCNATLGAITIGLPVPKEFKSSSTLDSDKLPKISTRNDRAAMSSAM